jgi:NAD(P)-dependent dehydrogenase (short-subunit alcohol dehydrogenase family)
MNVRDKIILVTGGANGIGKALCERFAAEGARKIFVADVDAANAQAVAKQIGGAAFRLDVGNETEVKTVVAEILRDAGQIDLVCSNAGIAGALGGLEVANDVWQRIYEINVLSHLYLARAVFPAMLSRGAGYFLLTVSAAGLLTHFDAAPYAVSKHAALAFAEYLAISYAEAGIRISCLCPQGVKTAMIAAPAGEPENFLMAEAITPEACADAVIKGLETEKFLILPHPEVAEYIVNKAENYDRWLHSLRKMRNAERARIAAANEKSS